LERAKLVGEGHGGIDAVQLVEVDALEPEPAQAAVARGAKVLGSPVRLPLVGPGTLEARLGCDHEPPRVGVERLGDEPLAHLGAVGVGRIDEVDTELDGPVQHGDRFAWVARLAPNAPAGEPHGAEAETVDGQLAAQEEGPAPGGGTCFNTGVAGALRTMRTKGRRHVCPNTHETSLVPREESLELPRRRHTSGHPAPATPRGAPFAALRTHEARRVHTHRAG